VARQDPADFFDMFDFQQKGHGGDEPHARSAEKRRAFAAERVPNRVR